MHGFVVKSCLAAEVRKERTALRTEPGKSRVGHQLWYISEGNAVAAVGLASQLQLEVHQHSGIVCVDFTRRRRGALEMPVGGSVRRCPGRAAEEAGGLEGREEHGITQAPQVTQCGTNSGERVGESSVGRETQKPSQRAQSDLLTGIHSRNGHGGLPTQWWSHTRVVRLHA